MSDGSEISPGYFDQWYADMGAGVAPKDHIAQRHLGLPAYLLSTSLLTWEGIQQVVEALRLPVGGVLLDLACGRGGYGLEVAARASARLIGVDFSAEAIRLATENAAALGRSADFQIGELAATGLPDRSVNGVICVDAIQFARRPADAYAELSRVLIRRGRVVLTSWEPVDRTDPRLPDRLRSVDIARGLREAGLRDVEVVEQPTWRDAERSMWEEAAALDPGDDPALQSFHDEGLAVLERFHLTRRVMATATAA